MLRANNGNALKRRQAGSSSRTVDIIVAHPVEYYTVASFCSGSWHASAISANFCSNFITHFLVLLLFLLAAHRLKIIFHSAAFLLLP